MTSTATPAPAAERPARVPSSTPTLLRRLRTALVLLAVLAGAGAALLTIEQHAVSSSAGEHTATAVMQAYAARQALVDADSQAVQTIPLGAGPSGQYQDDIAAAAQSLEQVAENNTAGETGTRALQLLEGLLSAYTTLIDQADAHYRMAGSGTSSGEGGVGVQYLWSASELMHTEILTDGPLPGDKPQDLQSAANACLAPAASRASSSGQRDSLADLQCYEQKALDEQRSSLWVKPWLFAAWVVLALAVVITLTLAQRLFAVRLRRLLSSYLTLAVAAVVGLGLVTAHVVASQHAYDAAQSGPLATVFALQDLQTADTDQKGQSALAENVLEHAPDQQGLAEKQAESDTTVLSSAHAALSRARYQPSKLAEVPGDIAVQQDAYEAGTTAAGAGYLRSLFIIIVLTVLLVLLIFLGFQRHLDEYRYQSS